MVAHIAIACRQGEGWRTEAGSPDIIRSFAELQVLKPNRYSWVSPNVTVKYGAMACVCECAKE